MWAEEIWTQILTLVYQVLLPSQPSLQLERSFFFSLQNTWPPKRCYSNTDRWIGGAQKIWEPVQTLGGSTKVDIWHYKSSKFGEYITPGGSPHGLWVTIMCQREVVLCNKSATLVEDAGNEGARLPGGLGVCEKSLYLQLSSALL